MREKNASLGAKLRSKPVLGAIATISAVAIVLSGTFAAVQNLDHATNQAKGDGLRYDAALINSYTPVENWSVTAPVGAPNFKDQINEIRVVNTGNNTQEYGDIFTRIQLKEYFETIDNMAIKTPTRLALDSYSDSYDTTAGAATRRTYLRFNTTAYTNTGGVAGTMPLDGIGGIATVTGAPTAADLAVTKADVLADPDFKALIIRLGLAAYPTGGTRNPTTGAFTPPAAGVIKDATGKVVYIDTDAKYELYKAGLEERLLLFRSTLDGNENYWYVESRKDDPNGTYGAFMEMLDPLGTTPDGVSLVGFYDGMRAVDPTDKDAFDVNADATNGTKFDDDAKGTGGKNDNIIGFADHTTDECVYDIHEWTTDGGLHVCPINQASNTGATTPNEVGKKSDGTDNESYHDYVQWLLNNGAIELMSAWDGVPVAKWILDDESESGWAYWGEALAPGQSTANLLSKVTLVTQPSTMFYYAIHADMQATSVNDIVTNWGVKTDAAGTPTPDPMKDAPQKYIDAFTFYDLQNVRISLNSQTLNKETSTTAGDIKFATEGISYNKGKAPTEVTWSIVGTPPTGASIDATTGVVTAGTGIGNLTIRATMQGKTLTTPGDLTTKTDVTRTADATIRIVNPNWYELTGVTITTPATYDVVNGGSLALTGIAQGIAHGTATAPSVTFTLESQSIADATTTPAAAGSQELTLYAGTTTGDTVTVKATATAKAEDGVTDVVQEATLTITIADTSSFIPTGKYGTEVTLSPAMDSYLTKGSNTDLSIVDVKGTGKGLNAERIMKSYVANATVAFSNAGQANTDGFTLNGNTLTIASSATSLTRAYIVYSFDYIDANGATQTHTLTTISYQVR